MKNQKEPISKPNCGSFNSLEITLQPDIATLPDKIEATATNQLQRSSSSCSTTEVDCNKPASPNNSKENLKNEKASQEHIPSTLKNDRKRKKDLDEESVVIPPYPCKRPRKVVSTKHNQLRRSFATFWQPEDLSLESEDWSKEGELMIGKKYSRQSSSQKMPKP